MTVIAVGESSLHPFVMIDCASPWNYTCCSFRCSGLFQFLEDAPPFSCVSHFLLWDCQFFELLFWCWSFHVDLADVWLTSQRQQTSSICCGVKWVVFILLKNRRSSQECRKLIHNLTSICRKRLLWCRWTGLSRSLWLWWVRRWVCLLSQCDLLVISDEIRNVSNSDSCNCKVNCLLQLWAWHSSMWSKPYGTSGHSVFCVFKLQNFLFYLSFSLLIGICK